MGRMRRGLSTGRTRAGTEPVAPNPEAPNPLHNDDNYVFFALEVWFMKQCKVAAFADLVPETI